MSRYKERYIRFQRLLPIGDWQVKLYTISKTPDFRPTEVLKHLQHQLADWLKLENGFNAEHDHIAFLIVHAGTEGIFSLLNWWVGSNMLNTHIFFTPYEHLSKFERISGEGLAPCIWELEVIEHERQALIKHILKAEKADFDAYLADSFSKVC